MIKKNINKILIGVGASIVIFIIGWWFIRNGGYAYAEPETMKEVVTATTSTPSINSVKPITTAPAAAPVMSGQDTNLTITVTSSNSSTIAIPATVEEEREYTDEEERWVSTFVIAGLAFVWYFLWTRY